MFWATQMLIQRKGKNMKVEITGSLRPGVTAKDITTAAVIGETGTAGGTGYVIEYCGAVREVRCRWKAYDLGTMAIEGGARAGLIAPDEKTSPTRAAPYVPKGAAWEAAVAY